jgi:Glu-tRNA(Gln) amidotransferase subunit E-like FAD-binding protein
MTPRQGQLNPAQLEAAFERIQAALDEIVEKQKGASDDKVCQESRPQPSANR